MKAFFLKSQSLLKLIKKGAKKSYTLRTSYICPKKKQHMKSFTFLILLFFGFTHAQHHAAQQDKPATHGMLLMGTTVIYASHLPMFHSPHDYQIIVALELDAKTKQLFIEDQVQHPHYSCYTLEPEKFVLPEMMAQPRPFKANLYRGHFERGGTKIATDVVVSIQKVLYSSKFAPKATPTENGDFILFGNEKEQFLAHKITKSPAFDQVIQVTTSLPWKNNSHYVVSGFSNEKKPLGVSSNTIEAKMDQNTISLVLLRQLYLEFEDLK